MLKENYRRTAQTAPQTSNNASVLWREVAQDGYSAASHAARHKPVEAWRTTYHTHTPAHHCPAEASDALPSSIRILLIDPSTIVCAGLHTMLAEARDMVIVGATLRGADALHLVRRLQPNVILIDLMAPEQAGVELIEQLHQAHPACQIIVLTTFCEEQRIHAALQAGALAYLLKDVPKLDLLGAIRAAARGEPTLHPVAQRALMHQTTHSPFRDLTTRELGVLRLIGQGCSNRVIGETLCLTEGTVKGYVSTILAKLQVADRTQAALYAVKHGLGNG